MFLEFPASSSRCINPSILVVVKVVVATVRRVGTTLSAVVASRARGLTVRYPICRFLSSLILS